MGLAVHPPHLNSPQRRYRLGEANGIWLERCDALTRRSHKEEKWRHSLIAAAHWRVFALLI